MLADGVLRALKHAWLTLEPMRLPMALAHRTPALLPGLDVEIFVLSCEDLILHKLIAGRIIDRADAAALLRANRAGVNLPYLQDWVGRLALHSGWSEIWEEAFPGETAPHLPVQG
jgi:hypothetical protein